MVEPTGSEPETTLSNVGQPSDWMTMLFGPLGLFRELEVVPKETRDTLNKYFEPLDPFFIPGGLIKEALENTPPWFNDDNIFLGGTALGALLLTGGTIPRLMRDQTAPRKRRKAVKRENKPKTDYYEVLARNLDKAQMPASYAVASVLSQPIVALPFAISYIQGAENYGVITKEAGDRLQAIAAGLFGGLLAKNIAGALL